MTWIRKHRPAAQTTPMTAAADESAEALPIASAVQIDENERETVMLTERYGDSDPSMTDDEIVRAEIALGLTDPMVVLQQDVAALIASVSSKSDAMRVYNDYLDNAWYGTVSRETAAVICAALVQICQSWGVEPLDLWRTYAAEAPAPVETPPAG